MSESVQSSGGGSSGAYRLRPHADKTASASRSAAPGSQQTQSSQPGKIGLDETSQIHEETDPPSVPRNSSGIPPPPGDPRFEAYLNQLVRAGPRNALESLILMRYGKGFTPSTGAGETSLSILS